MMPKMIDHLAPIQCGVGVKGGCEAIIHASVKLVEEYMDDPTKAFCALDSINAFNVCSRQTFFDEVLEHMPGLYKLVTLLYGCAGKMFLGMHIVLSVTGTTQGCPLGPPLYSMALRPMTLIIKDQCPDLNLLCFYLDDGSLFGDVPDISRALTLVDTYGPQFGIYPNKTKTVVLCAKSLPQEDRERLFRGCEVTDVGVKLLGGAVGEEDFVRGMVSAKIEKVLHLMDEILQLQDPHRQFSLLKYCLSGYKLGHLLRVCPSSIYHTELLVFDRALDLAISATLGKPVTGNEREIINLPSKEGGFGLPSAYSIAGASYLASCAQSSKLQAEILALDGTFNREVLGRLLTAFSTSNQIPIIDANVLDSITLQHDLQSAANQGRVDEMMNRLSAREIEMLNARRSIEFVPWFNVIPSEPLEQYMPPDEFRAAIRFQLGKRFLPDSRTKCEACNSLMDSYADHATKCHKGGGLIMRHDTVRDTLMSLCRQAGYTTSTEDKDLLRDGSERRPADVFVRNYERDTHACLDVAIVAGGDVDGIRKKEVAKRREYLVDVENVGYRFLPFVMDSFGRLGLSAHRILNGLSYRYAETHLLSVAQAKGRLRGVIMQSMIGKQSEEILRRVWKL
jgi:hypothetical protein